ncbi:hypothetical protein [Maridesulfovibrio sp.]|uniref:hypothetical protein n=1 Tax=Maridesulfovibrio sp. TaxID=2795000 RepID=UPI002A18B070|nr:hypothetical protein [Maridesulfovibrio sp.]
MKIIFSPVSKAITLRFVLAFFIFLGSLFLNLPDAQCTSFLKDKDKKEVQLPKPVTEGINYLMQTVAGNGNVFDGSRIKALLAYVDQSEPTDSIINLPKRDSANGAAMRMTVNAGLDRILEYTYNPDIPNYAIYPSVIRVSGWYPESQFYADKVQPWKYLGDCDSPRMWRGKEFEVNTPDSFGGGYYRYDLNRLLVLLKYDGRDAFLSVSRQADESEVGMKGLVVDDNQWNYFYSGIPGLTKGGMGWMDTYMYDSMSVSVYIQDRNDPNKTVNYLFKWLRAGWAGLNVVRPNHIFEGSQRFARAFNSLMESKTLPAPQEFAERVREIEAMPKAEVDARISEYAKNVEEYARKHPVISDKFQEVYEGGKYADKFTREERIGILVKEYVKQAMGKQCLIFTRLVQNDK